MFIDTDHPDAWDAFVYLDGFRIDHCIKADDQAGWVEVEVQDPATGGPLVDWVNDRIVTQRLYGSVRIVVVKSERERTLLKSSREYQHHLRPRASV